MRHIQTETKRKPKNKIWRFVEAYKHVLQFLSVPHALELQYVSFISRTFSNSRNVTAISTCSHRGISNRLPFSNRISQNMNEQAGEGETNLRGQIQLLRALKQAQCYVTDIATCSHRGISNRLPLRNRICQEHEWNGRRRRNQLSWLLHVASRLSHLSTTIFTR